MNKQNAFPQEGRFFVLGDVYMPYIPVPKDLTRVKTKFLFNLTKRQLVCFGGGALVGVPLFFLLKGRLATARRLSA